MWDIYKGNKPINVYDVCKNVIPLKNSVEKVCPRDSWTASEVDSFMIKGCTKSAKSLVIHCYRKGICIVGEVKRMSFFKDCCAEDHGGVYLNINNIKYRVARWEVI